MTHDELVSQFSLRGLLKALQVAPELRTNLLVKAAGVHKKIARLKSNTGGAEDLLLALNEGVCDARLIVQLVGEDGYVRYWGADKIWEQINCDKSWLEGKLRSQARMIFTLRAALAQGLLKGETLVAYFVDQGLLAQLPRERLEHALARALEGGLKNTPFSLERLVDEVPWSLWVEHVGVADIWERVAAPSLDALEELQIHRDSGLIPRPIVDSGPVSAAPPSRYEVPEIHPIIEPPVEPLESLIIELAPEPRVLATPLLENQARPTLIAPAAPPASDSAPSKPPFDLEEVELRKSVCAKLEGRDRLPPRAGQMRTQVLVALESIYKKISVVHSNEEKTQCFLDAFPNETMLYAGVSALAEALDPRLSPQELERRQVGARELIQIVLFEEHRRLERVAHGLPSFASASSRNVPSHPAPPQSTIHKKSGNLRAISPSSADRLHKHLPHRTG